MEVQGHLNVNHQLLISNLGGGKFWESVPARPWIGALPSAGKASPDVTAPTYSLL